MSSFNFKKTRRKNFKCEGECPLPSLMLELATHVGCYKQVEQEKKIPDVSPRQLRSLGFLTPLILLSKLQFIQWCFPLNLACLGLCLKAPI